MVRKLGREEYCEKENLHQRFLSRDIDEVIKKILENPSEELIHQLMYYVELRNLIRFHQIQKMMSYLQKLQLKFYKQSMNLPMML